MNETLEPGGIARRLLLRRAFGAGVVVLIGGRAGCMAAAEAEVIIDNFTFSPTPLTVKVGSTVTWFNHDDIPHSIVCLALKLTSHPLDTDDSFAYTFEKAGTFDYLCGLHPHMHGQVVVGLKGMGRRENLSDCVRFAQFGDSFRRIAECGQYRIGMLARAGGCMRNAGASSSMQKGRPGRCATLPFGMVIASARPNALSCGSSNRSDGVRTGENGMFASSMMRSRSPIARSRTIAATSSRSAGRFFTRSALVRKRSSASRSGRVELCRRTNASGCPR